MNNLNQAPWEATQAAQDLVRYRKDFRAFATEQLKIRNQPFNFWPCQIPLVESVEKQFEARGFARCVWLKSRQVGASTLAQAFVAWRTMLWPNTNAVVIADEAERSKTLFEICRGFYDQLDDSIRPIGRYITKRELVFANPSHATRASDPGLRSRIVVDSAHKKNIAIGSSWDIASLSECARFKDPAFVMDGIIPAVHRVPGTMVIMESSAEMAGTWFRDFYFDSKKGQTAFEAKFVPWYLQPEYFVCPVCMKNFCVDKVHDVKGRQTLDLMAEERAVMTEFGLRPGHIKWMREKLSEFGGDWNLFRQNFPLTDEDAWITPGAQAFPSKALKEQRQNIQPPKRRCEVHPGPRILDAPNGKLLIWEEPVASKIYDIGADIAQGGREDEGEEREWGDYSVACVLERGTNRQVAEWASRAISPLDMSTMLFWLGTYYNNAQIAIETNGIGGSTNQQLTRMGYSNCLTPDHRVLTADMRWIAVGELRKGDWLIGFDENPLAGRRLRRYRSSQVIGCVPRKQVVYRIVLSDGAELKATGEHKWLASTPGRRAQSWVRTDCLRPGARFPKYFVPWSSIPSYDLGWMGGILDGEGSGGCYSNKGGRVQTAITITQNPGLVLDKACDLLRRWSVPFCLEQGGHGPKTKRIRIAKKSEIARLLGTTRPVRLLASLSPEWFRALRGEWIPRVVAVERLGQRDVMMFGTTTETYIAEGYASHNCYMWRFRDEMAPRYSRKTGWETNPRSKPWLVGFAIHELMNNRCVIRSEVLYREMESYVQKAVREWGAVAGAFDDRVMAWQIALLTSDDENFEKYYGLAKGYRDRPEAPAVKAPPGPWEADLTFKRHDRVDEDVKPWGDDGVSHLFSRL